ncbi:MAG: hypothetical protein H0V01_14975 [Bacteroidetes bacterium]|nr:hypothetical protein [Bacteroidota bacterium]HET6244655.1 hypothetical protein [Bacteroidia bacterium]
MPIPNTSTLYQKISNGSEGGQEFARFIKILLQADYSIKGINFVSESDASGDYKKVDGYIRGNEDFKKLAIGFQYKFYSANLTSNQKKEIQLSIESALTENKFLQEFILITPEDWYKEQQEWFDVQRRKYENSYTVESNGLIRMAHFKLTHWGHTKIIELVLKHDHIGYHYFPELFPQGVGKFKLSQSSIDCTISNWFLFKGEKYSYYQKYSSNSSNLSADPVFDFQFTNSSPEILLLNKIEIHIEKIDSQLKGIPAEHFLHSIGTIHHEMDYNNRINTKVLNAPMIFESLKAKRFQLQLRKFHDCPGNCVTLKFWFHFENFSVPTESFYLSF